MRFIQQLLVLLLEQRAWRMTINANVLAFDCMKNVHSSLLQYLLLVTTCQTCLMHVTRILIHVT